MLRTPLPSSHLRRCFGPKLLLLALLLAAGHAQAQGPNTGGPTPSAVPLDGGAALLLATGVAYGLKRLRRGKR